MQEIQQGIWKLDTRLLIQTTQTHFEDTEFVGKLSQK